MKDDMANRINNPELKAAIESLVAGISSQVSRVANPGSVQASATGPRSANQAALDPGAGVEDCFGTAGTFGTLGGCLGSFGTYGCSEVAE
jgi:hypothetical protein